MLRRSVPPPCRQTAARPSCRRCPAVGAPSRGSAPGGFITRSARRLPPLAAVCARHRDVSPKHRRCGGRTTGDCGLARLARRAAPRRVRAGRARPERAAGPRLRMGGDSERQGEQRWAHSGQQPPRWKRAAECLCDSRAVGLGVRKRARPTHAHAHAPTSRAGTRTNAQLNVRAPALAARRAARGHHSGVRVRVARASQPGAAHARRRRGRSASVQLECARAAPRHLRH